jgi:diguanylate cyclase (GGDEF)-like protein
MTMPSFEFYRVDPLTGCNNFLSFVEVLDHLSSGDGKQSFSILYLDLNHLKMLNDTKGHSYGDSAIRWLGIVLQEESHSPTYRIGGDEFAVILTGGTHANYEELLNGVFARLNREGEQLEIPAPAARIALIHYDHNGQFSKNDVMFHLWEATLDVKTNQDGTVKQYMAYDLIGSENWLHQNQQDTNGRSHETLHWIANQAVHRILQMGRAIDAAQKASYLDSISGLPNMQAALLKLEKEIVAKQPFSILLIDGDNIRRYNSISYAAGDEMIQNMGAVLSGKLRPGDFVARWRTGDEFIVILPNTSGPGAKIVGERFCTAIREASKAWKFPTSISIGIATYPKHGDNVNALVDVAEAANKRAKDEGKDRVILAELEVLSKKDSQA